MKQSVKDQIIAALRTTTLPQTTGSYRRSDQGIGPEYCALGVVADAFGYDWKMVGLNYRLVPDFLGDIGMNQHVRFRIQELNDFDHLSFAAIADYLDDMIQAEDDTNVLAEVEEIVSEIESLTTV